MIHFFKLEKALKRALGDLAIQYWVLDKIGSIIGGAFGLLPAERKIGQTCFTNFSALAAIAGLSSRSQR